MMQAQQQQQMQMQQEYYGEEEDEDGMQGLYVEGLADRIWDDNEQWRVADMCVDPQKI